MELSPTRAPLRRGSDAEANDGFLSNCVDPGGYRERRVWGMRTRSCGRGWTPAIGSVRGPSRVRSSEAFGRPLTPRPPLTPARHPKP